MAKISLNDFGRELETLVQPQDQIIFIQSRLATFGHLIDVPIQTVVAGILQTIEEVVGPDRTLVFPAFSFGFGRKRLFDPIRTRPETGVLVEQAWRAGRYRRTTRPMNNYLIRGPLTRAAEALRDETSWDDNSILAWLAHMKARAITLGISEPDYGWIVVHRAEQIANVPYRYYKRLRGKLELNGVAAGTCEEVLFVRPLRAPCISDYTEMNTTLAEKGLLVSGRDARLALRAVGCADVVDTALQMLSADPYALIPERAELIDWVAKGKAGEIADLAPDERWNPAPRVAAI
jgi:aminoglycoside N3'-acetyltransferase